MADKYATPVLEEGAYTPSYKTNLTGRQNPILGAIRDTALETAASAIDVLATPYAYGRMGGQAAGSEKFEEAGRLGQRVASEAKDVVRGWKTDYGRQEDKNGGENANWLERVGSALPAALPSIGVAALTGPAAPLTWGALAHAQQSQQFEEELYKMPRTEIEKTSGYKRYQAQGLRHDDILREMHREMRNDIAAWGPNVALNVATAGIVSKLAGKIGSRTIAKTMTDRLLKNAAIEMPEAALGGAATGAAQAFGRQRGEMNVGIRDEYDLGGIGQEAWQMGTTLGTFGAAGVGIRSIRGPAKEAPSTGKTTGNLLDDAKNKPVAPNIGTELQPVAVENLSDGKPDPVTAKTGEAPPATGPAAINPEGSTAKVTPVAPVAGAIDPTVTPAGKPAPAPVEAGAVPPVAPVGEAAPTAFRDIAVVQGELNDAIHAARSLDAAIPEQKATPEWQAEHARVMDLVERLDTERERIEGATKPTEPTAEAVQAHTDITAPPEAAAAAVQPVDTAAAPAKMTLDDLKVRAQELGRTGGTIDAMNAAIKEYTTQHGLKKLPEHTEVTRAWSAGKAEAKAEAAATREAGLETARQEKATKTAAEAEAKAAAKLAKTEAAAEKKRLKDEEREAKKTAKAQKALAQAQSKGYAGLATKEKEAADTAERARLQAEAKAAAQKVIDAREGKPAPVEYDDIAALVDETPTETPPVAKPAPAGVGPAGEAALTKVKRKILTPEEAQAAADALLAAADTKGKGKGKGKAKTEKPAAAAKPPSPKGRQARIDAHAKKNQSKRYVAEPIPEASRFGPQFQLYDTTTDKAGKKFQTEAQAKAEADVKNAEETNTLARRAIDEEDRLQREAAAKGAPTVTPAGKPDAPAAAAPGPTKLVRKADVDKAEAEKAEAARIQTEAREAEAKRLAENEAARVRQEARRKTDQAIREDAAQRLVKDHQTRSHNQQGDINALEQSMAGKEPAGAVPEMLLLANTAKELANAYDAELLRLSGGKPHETFTVGRGKDGEARGGVGDYHNFLVYLREYARRIEDLITKKEFVEAKDRTDKYVKAMTLVQKGEIKDFAAAIREMNEAISMETRTHTMGEVRVEGALKEKAERSQTDIIDAIDKDMDELGIPVNKPTMQPLKDANGKLVLDANGRIQLVAVEAKPIEDRRAKEIKVDDNQNAEWVGGKEHQYDWARVDHILDGLQKWMAKNGYSSIPDEFLPKLLTRLGEKPQKTTFGKLMENQRPDHPVMGAIFDIVHGHMKDLPAHVFSPEAMWAIDMANTPGGEKVIYSRAYWHGNTGSGYFRTDTLVPRTIFHEALHGMTHRAMEASKRLTFLVDTMRFLIKDRYANDPQYKDTAAYRLLTGANNHEFVSEFYTRPDAFEMVNNFRLTRLEMNRLEEFGYEGRGIPKDERSLGRRFIDAILEALGFKEASANTISGSAVVTDMVRDVFKTEMMLRQRDIDLGIPDVGKVYSWADIDELARQDPVRGPAAWDLMQKGDHAKATENLIAMADKMDATTADKSIEYLNRVNSHYYGRVQDAVVTRMSNPEEIHGGVIDFIEQRLGHQAADWAWQIDNKFGTPLRKFVQGMAYTNDIGSTLEQGFQDILRPLKDAWSRRENFSQKYMDESGANELIDDIAKARNAIVDRHHPNSLWSKFENLMIRESYGRSRADVELGRDENKHINTGDLKDRQAVADWVANRELLEEIKARNPELIALRNRIFDFTKKELETRNKAAVRDMLLEFKQAGRGDEVALSALTKDVMRQNDKMTHAERAAMDRVLKVGKESDVYKNILAERAWMKKTHGEASKTYQDYLKKSLVKEARALKPAGELYEAYKKTRDDVRTIVDLSGHNGPHVPFTRHGDHAVYAEYQVTPKAGVEYREVGEKAADDTHTMYDFKNRPDAEDFIDNTLSHPDIQISLRDATEVVYDTRTGEQAGVWTVVKPDGTAKTYEGREEANRAMEKGDTVAKKNLTPKDIEQMKEDGQPTAHLETWQRLTFNPKEFTTFESERAAHNYRDQLAQDTGIPGFKLVVSNVESPHDIIGRANTAYTSAEMKQWINRQEAMPEYQRMDPEEKAAWARKLRMEAARVTATAGRRTMNMPRNFAKGASTDLLKGMIGYAGNNSRAIADLSYRAEIDSSLADVEAYNAKYRNQSGFNARRIEGETDAAYRARRDAGSVASGHRARDDALREIKERLFAPPKIEGSWAQGIKRALQVSMISHLADTGYLIINAIEPWVFGASVSAGRHGWIPTYKEMALATALIEPGKLAKAAGQDIAAAAKGEFGPNNYEKLLLEAVTAPTNTRGDGVRLSGMLNHMFDKGLAARDVGMEVERIHDPSSNIAGRALDSVDNVFRGFNTGVETFNRAMLAVSNYRLEYDRAIRDGLTPAKADLQAIRYAEDSIFKSAGDYGAWNNPRYFSNPVMKLALQFKKYPLRIFSVYADAVIGAWRGQPEKQKQLAYMLLAQAVAAGGMGLPLASFGAGITNAMYLLGITDNNWEDFEFALRKQLVKYTGVAGAELALRGALRFTGADFSQKMSQNSFIFQGSPQSRDAKDLVTTLALTGFGAPGGMAKRGLDGYQHLREGISDYSSGARAQGTSKAMAGAGEIVQIKVIHNFMRMAGMMMGDSPKGLPKDQTSTTAQALITGAGFTPTSVSNKLDAKYTTTRQRKKESEVHNRWVNRYRDAPDKEKAGIKRQIDSYNETLDDPELRITMADLWKAQNRKKAEQKRDERKIGVPLSGRQKVFGDVGGYFRVD